MCDDYFERVNKKFDNLTDEEFLKLIEESQEEKEIHNQYLKAYEKFKNKGIYKYTVNEEKYDKDVQELIDVLGEDD